MGTWAARGNNGNTKHDNNNIEIVDPSNLVEINDSFIPSDQESTESKEPVNIIDTIVKGNELIISHPAKASNSMNHHQKDLYISLNTHDIYNIHSGLVLYSGSESESEEESVQEILRSPSVQEVSRESLLDQPTQAPSPSVSHSPTPSPTQRRRNQQAEYVLANFGSRSLLALLTESLRREESERSMALQRLIHDAGALRVSHHPNQMEPTPVHENI